MPDKVAFMRAVLLCVQLLRGKPFQKRLLLAENQFAFSIRPSAVFELCLNAIGYVHSYQDFIKLLVFN